MTDARPNPRLGAVPCGRGTHFEVWAPEHHSVAVVFGPDANIPGDVPLQPAGDGYFTADIDGAAAGHRYAYRLDGHGPFPDPASRFQPDGVHGFSAIVDPRTFSWRDEGWRGVRSQDLSLYELHIGTFTPEGSFQAAAERLPYLRDLGITAIEVMPVGDFAGAHNWGYDGVALFAPARCYGTPDDFRRLVDRAHQLGLGVLLDVVYNHVGPDGAYIFSFSPWYFTDRYPSPWGKSVNLDGPHAAHVRRFLLENARHWIDEYHLDGLRLDATHAMRDDSQEPFLRELTREVKAAAPEREVVVIAEDDRNLARIVRPLAEDGFGLDGVWADDFHHQVRRALSGDHDGYYVDYSGTAVDIATTIRQAWFYTGQHSAYAGHARGTDAAGVERFRFVYCLQNHDQIGNRANGDRLHHEGDLAAVRAATALLLTLPATPLLFMGQEWAASTPFLYFTDHGPELGRLVSEGRRREFERFAAFADPLTRARIPDPQARTTFEAAKLTWDELDAPGHRGMLRLHQALLALRRQHAVFGGGDAAPVVAEAVDDTSLLVVRSSLDLVALVAVQLRGAGTVDLGAVGARLPGSADDAWTVRLTTEQPEFVGDPLPPQVASGASPSVTFARPGAAILTRRAA